MGKLWVLLGFFMSVGQVYAGDIPTGMVRTAEGSTVNTVEILLSPQYTFAPSGTYLNSEVRFQPSDEFGAAAGFGAGEQGFNFGAYATWNALPDLKDQPAFAVSAGVYFNKIQSEDYLVMRLSPIVSEAFRADWGVITPYGALQFAPAFRIGDPGPANLVTLRATMGTQVALDEVSGMRLWLEFGLGIANSAHQAVIGVSYPLGGESEA